MRDFLTVSQLNRMVAGLLEQELPLLGVQGEVSNLMRAGSGHWYFSLKDAGAQVRCVMFRGRNRFVEFAPRDGDHVEIRALASLYEGRGEFQLIVEAMRRAGDGDLYRRFLTLKAALQSEGLFEAARKRPLPPSPATIGIVTSPRGAALRDVLATLRRRAPGVAVVVYPSAVQGGEAPMQLLAAMRRAFVRRECQVLLLVRGGGSIEDLWAFNDEVLARAIADAPVPVVSGIGHETDFTIADFVADVRAATPTAAAELVAPDRRELGRVAGRLAERLQHAMLRGIDRASQRFDSSVRLLRPPSALWRDRARRSAMLAQRLAAAGAAQHMRRSGALERLAAGLRAPRTELAAQRLATLEGRLAAAMRDRRERAGQRLGAVAGALELVSPQAVLERGYAIVGDAQGRVLRDASRAVIGEPLKIRLAVGALDAEVTATQAGPARADP